VVRHQQHPAAGDPRRPRRLLGGQEAAALFLKAPNTTLLYEMELAAEGLLCGLCSFRLTGQEEIEIAGLPPTRCKVEDFKEMVDDGPITADLSGYLGKGRGHGPHDDDNW